MRVFFVIRKQVEDNVSIRCFVYKSYSIPLLHINTYWERFSEYLNFVAILKFI
uniref:Uncharacterized protein n=1 Tax=Lepeophtheirus salmonis TaxID=72036 RepID=A0A0K2UG10_LEPSM